MLKYIRTPKYMTMSGEAFGYPANLRKTFLSPVFMASVLATSASSFLPDQHKFNLFDFIVPIMVASYTRRSEKEYYNDFLKKKVIHTEFNLTQWMNTQPYLDGVKSQRNHEIKRALQGAAIGASVVGVSNYVLKTPWTVPDIGLPGAFLIHHLSAAYRFHKVAKGDWTIVPEPRASEAIAHLDL